MTLQWNLADIVDSEKNELAWRGTAIGVVGKSQKSKEEAQEDTDEVINKIMMDFPPETKK